MSIGSGLITIKTIGDLKATTSFLSAASRFTTHIEDKLLEKYAKEGVEKLKIATPKDTGKTAESWTYEIKRTKHGASIEFNNTNINNGVNIALLIQYGHGTNNGGYVKGLDYLNPVLAEEFKEFADGVFAEVRKL